jgi:pimeloyl-ACP methyl ester carboxylesterase
MKNTIIFIHGMFQNAKSWDNWVAYFTEKGYNCIAESWPLHEGDPADLRANIPAGLGELRLSQIINKFHKLVLEQPEPPILIGHSVGGLVAQILVNNNVAKLGIPISSVAPNAMISFDWGFFKNSTLISNPLKGDDPFIMDLESFHGSFCNTMSMEETTAAYEATATHDSRNVLRDCLGEDGKVDVDLPHVPLLFIAGAEDQIIPAGLNEKNAKAYNDELSYTDFKEFASRGHYICGQPGWEEVADHVFNWIEEKGNIPPYKTS